MGILAGNWKQYCHISNQNTQICLMGKFKNEKKIRISNFGTKNDLFRYFGARNIKTFCHILNQHSRICQSRECQARTKMPKFETKNTLFWYFFDWNLTRISPYLISPASSLSNGKFLWKMKMIKFETKNSLFGCVFFLYGNSFTTIHQSEDCREKGIVFILTRDYHFHPLQRNLDICQAITADKSLRIDSSHTFTGNLWLLNASH